MSEWWFNAVSATKAIFCRFKAIMVREDQGSEFTAIRYHLSSQGTTPSVSGQGPEGDA